MSVVLLMGAGFAKAAGSPLADELFDQTPIGGSHERDSQVNLVQSQWYEWQKTHPVDGAEAFITLVYRNAAMIPGTGVIWRAFQTYLASRISAAFVHWNFVDGRANRSSDNFMDGYASSSHERWWDTLATISTIATHYTDYKLGHMDRTRFAPCSPSSKTPGFRYDQGPE